MPGCPGSKLVVHRHLGCCGPSCSATATASSTTTSAARQHRGSKSQAPGQPSDPSCSPQPPPGPLPPPGPRQLHVPLPAAAAAHGAPGGGHVCSACGAPRRTASGATVAAAGVGSQASSLANTASYGRSQSARCCGALIRRRGAPAAAAWRSPRRTQAPLGRGVLAPRGVRGLPMVLLPSGSARSHGASTPPAAAGPGVTARRT